LQSHEKDEKHPKPLRAEISVEGQDTDKLTGSIQKPEDIPDLGA